MPSHYKAITEHNEEQLGKDTSSRKTQVSMYSDPTHFVYEILQNADDYEATEVLFKLSEDDIMIEHNGVPFKEENVRAITYFGKSTSREALVKTGRFGIGFKSVFAFTATPIIISGSEHFQIYGLYRVREHPYPDGFSRSRTRIILPFDHESEQPDYVEELMSKEEAYRQISKCLIDLDMNTLLFTRNIREIRWEIDNQSECYSREDEVDDNARLTTIKNSKNENTCLVFQKTPTWENKKHKPVEIVFAVDAQSQLTPIHDEFLHVLFPTTQKTDLRFILNGPYRTNPARETISYTDAFNRHLMEVTCELMKELLPKLRNRKLLTLQSLSILPNKEDTLIDFYTPLLNIVISEFRNEKLTPTKRGDHAAASGLYRLNTELSDLLSDEDLATLLGKDRSLSLKIDEISQQRDERGRFVQDPNAQFIDDFLNTLRIPDWNMTELVSKLLAQPEMVVDWFRTKTVEWHQTFYALLYDFLRLRWTGSSLYSPESNLKNKLSDLSIIPCSDDIYRAGDKCFFPSDDVERDERFPRILKGFYSSGKDNDQMLKALGFLRAIGVRPVDEAVEIETILKQRYKNPYTGSFQLHLKDIKRFIALVEDQPDNVSLFQGYCIFKTHDGGCYHNVSMIFLDAPFLDTGLNACYQNDKYWEFIEEEGLNPHFSLDYEESDIDLKKLGKFAEKLGAKTKLTVDLQSALGDHPESTDFADSSDESGNFNFTDTGISEDYRIHEFQILLDDPTITKSELIWQSMLAVPSHYLKAKFRWNQKQKTIIKGSSLVYDLKDRKWVPQQNRSSVSYVTPRNALRDLLPAKGFSWPKGYPDDAGEDWLKAIEFGKIVDKQKEENAQQNQKAKEFGFDSVDEANTMAEIANTWKEQGKSPEESLKKLVAQERRKESLIIELDDAGEKIYKIVPRSTKVTGNTIDPRTALRARYTMDENSMHCQMCSKSMPFKKRNSDEDYFEAVEALGKGYFFKEHEAQYLALCPECAAAYTEYVKRDPKARETFHDALKNSDSPQIHVESNGRTIRIWFEDKHWQDLKTVLYYYENIYDPDDAD